jgi:DeoR/GlpR family transcriptional regulator of sugar metabolism
LRIVVYVGYCSILLGPWAGVDQASSEGTKAVPQRPGARAVLAPKRHASILETVAAHGAVRVSELTQLLGVSEMTIRRDLDVLESRGLLTKVHGGATTMTPGSADEPGFEAKSTRERAEKRLIAQQAATLVQPHSAIAITAGTTTWALATELVDVPGLTVVTNSVRVADVLYASPRSDRTVILTGGIRTPSDAMVGPVAVASIRSLHVDMVFMGVHGLDVAAGITTPNVEEAETNRAFVRSGRRLVVVADDTKWGVVALSSIVPLSEVHTWVVNRVPAGADLVADAPDLYVVAPDDSRKYPKGPAA